MNCFFILLTGTIINMCNVSLIENKITSYSKGGKSIDWKKSEYTIYFNHNLLYTIINGEDYIDLSVQIELQKRKYK